LLKNSLKSHLWKVILLALAVPFFIYSIGIEPNELVVRNYDIAIPRWPAKLNGLKIAVLTDIHAGVLFIDTPKMRKIVDDTNATNPDLIFILGDFIAGHTRIRHITPDEIMGALGGLKAKYGVYAVLGNHDWWYNGKAMQAAIHKTDIHLLENAAQPVDINGERIWIAGIEDMWTRRPNFMQALADVPDGAPVLALTHNPDIFVKSPETINCLFAGHTHGGQVRLPVVGTLIVPSDFDSRFVQGHIIESGKHMFVSSGIGTSVAPIRFCVPPEISVVKLEGQNQ
jgi:predicted MPP superfamily phosphohydrolase